MNTQFNNTVTTALGMIVALTWSDAIKTLFQPGGLFSISSIWGPWVVALVATCIAIWGNRLLILITSKVKARLRVKTPQLGTIQGFNATEPMMSVPAPVVNNPPKKE
jgi:hypothetical protein